MEIKTIAVINLPNGITLLRILCSLVLLFCMPLSLPFYVLYAAAGLSDIFDGFIARKTNTSTQFGAKLDTFADIVFTAVALIKILPILKLPVWVIAWVGVIALIKLVTLYDSNHQHTIHGSACLHCRDSRGDHGKPYNTEYNPHRRKP